MTQIQSQRSVTNAVCNTGPLISAFQSGSFSLLAQIFAEIRISTVCIGELIQHGWGEEVKASASTLMVVSLSSEEERQAFTIAEAIAQQPMNNDPVILNHLGEVQAIQLALRPAHRNDILLLDERAARMIAKQKGVKLSGFPGVLLMAVQNGLISAEDLRNRLESCRKQGTHYGVAFIQQVYEMAKQNRRSV